jgi:hypothetical protein
MIACAWFALSCDRPQPEASRVSPQSVQGDSSVRGRVRFLGPPPAPKVLKSEPCHDGVKREILDETVIVGPEQGLKNVFVYIEDGPLVDGRSLNPALLDQVNCVYTPHVVGVVVGQTLVVKSSDDVFHNTHYVPSRNPANNFGLKRSGEQREVRFSFPEIFTARCDVHPWMSAQIGVFDNPLFAVTGENGAFEINRVASGTYTLVARHELYGELRRTIEVGSGATVEIGFDYAPAP